MRESLGEGRRRRGCMWGLDGTDSGALLAHGLRHTWKANGTVRQAAVARRQKGVKAESIGTRIVGSVCGAP